MAIWLLRMVRKPGTVEVWSGQIGTGPQFGGAEPYGPVFFTVSKKGSCPGLDRTVASLDLMV